MRWEGLKDQEAVGGNGSYVLGGMDIMNKIFYLTALHFIEIFLKDGGFHSAISKSDQGCYFIIEQILEISRPELEFIHLTFLRLL